RHCLIQSPLFSTAPACSEHYTLSLHDALPISPEMVTGEYIFEQAEHNEEVEQLIIDWVDTLCIGIFNMAVTLNPQKILIGGGVRDRKSTRLNSSHVSISYAVFCLKKKNNDAVE